MGKLALPAQVVLYISRSGGAHGYWRNAPIGGEYFGYSDVPALMPLLVGHHTRGALHMHDDPYRDRGGSARDPVELHVKAGLVETTTLCDADDASVIDAQIAIHQGLADDHAALLATWQTAAHQLRGIVSSTWPPVLTVPRAFGSTTISLRWSTSMQAGETATMELAVDARKAKLWALEREAARTPNARMIADRPFYAIGEIPAAIDKFASVLARADLQSINVRRYITMRIAQHTPDPELLEDLLFLLGELCGDAPEPYR